VAELALRAVFDGRGAPEEITRGQDSVLAAGLAPHS
jgi:hypothetical protein